VVKAAAAKAAVAAAAAIPAVPASPNGFIANLGLPGSLQDSPRAVVAVKVAAAVRAAAAGMAGEVNSAISLTRSALPLTM
jgi:hypothetical protein